MNFFVFNIKHKVRWKGFVYSHNGFTVKTSAFFTVLYQRLQYCI